MNYALLLLAVAFNTTAYGILKSISSRPHDIVWAGMFGAGLLLGAANLFCFTAALRHLGLAVAYPAFAGASIACIVVMSAWAFDEPVSASTVAGAALVVAGIVVLSR
jgi:multidrug transporter EmrE-like cation transporter